jgi:hypothetical protein
MTQVKPRWISGIVMVVSLVWFVCGFGWLNRLSKMSAFHPLQTLESLDEGSRLAAAVRSADARLRHE